MLRCSCLVMPEWPVAQSSLSGSRRSSIGMDVAAWGTGGGASAAGPHSGKGPTRADDGQGQYHSNCDHGPNNGLHSVEKVQSSVRKWHV